MKEYSSVKEIPLFNKNEIETMTRKGMSICLGEKYLQSDNQQIRARMPVPPYLFADRILSIDAQYGKLEPSVIISEYDITDDCIMRKGEKNISQVVVFEAAHSCIFLLAYINIDSFFSEPRRYRVMQTETHFLEEDYFYVGDTIKIEFHIDQFIHNSSRMIMRCHYHAFRNGKLMLSSKNLGGMFTEKELISVNNGNYQINNRQTVTNSFDENDMGFYYRGEYLNCFKKIVKRPLYKEFMIKKEVQFVDKITEICNKGGQYDLGYAIAEKKIDAEFWPFACHFINDPVLPGTIIIEGINQVIDFYLQCHDFADNLKEVRVGYIGNQDSKCKFIDQVLPDCKIITYIVEVKKLVHTDEYIEILFAGNALADNKLVLSIKDIGIKITGGDTNNSG